MVETQLSSALEGDRRRRRGLTRAYPIEARPVVIDVRKRDGCRVVLDPVLLRPGHLEAISQRADQRLADLAERAVATFGRLGPLGSPLAPDHLRHVVRADETTVPKAWDLTAALGAIDEIDRSSRRRNRQLVENAGEDALGERDLDRWQRGRRSLWSANEELVGTSTSRRR